MLRDMAACGKDRSDSNACRNLQKLLHKSGYSVRVKLSTITTPVRMIKRGCSTTAMVQFPILKLSDWCHRIFRSGGHFWLAGQTLDSAHSFGQTLHQFWERFRIAEPNLPFWDLDYDWRYCLPYFIHGDEGRGSAKRPIMVLSAQAVTTTPDMSASNQTG